MLEGVLERKGVHDGREHAHIVGLGAIHALSGSSKAAEDIAAADDDTDLNALVMKGLDLSREAGGDGRVDTVAALPHQGFTGQLQKDAVIEVVGHSSSLVADFIHFSSMTVHYHTKAGYGIKPIARSQHMRKIRYSPQTRRSNATTLTVSPTSLETCSAYALMVRLESLMNSCSFRTKPLKNFSRRP